MNSASPPRRTPRLMGGFDLLREFICRGAHWCHLLCICSFACFSYICTGRRLLLSLCVNVFNVYSNGDLIIQIYNDTLLQYTIHRKKKIHMPCPLALILAGIIVLCLQSCSHPDSLICMSCTWAGAHGGFATFLGFYLQQTGQAVLWSPQAKLIRKFSWGKHSKEKVFFQE